MSDQLDLQPVASAQASPEPDPIFAAVKAAHAEHPKAKLLHVTHAAAGATFVVAIPPESPWHELLPDWQATRILPRKPDAA